jgi:predicted kinase
MRNIVFTRGAAGAGKTTFLKESGIFEYAISPDNLRLFFQAPTMNIKGELGISQLQEKRVWELLLKVLEERMQKGEFIIIDATHTRENDFDKYKRLIEDNRYQSLCFRFF